MSELFDQIRGIAEGHADIIRRGGTLPCTWPVVNPDTGAFCCLTHGLASEMADALTRLAAAADHLPALRLTEAESERTEAWTFDAALALSRWLDAYRDARALLARLAGTTEEHHDARPV